MTILNTNDKLRPKQFIIHMLADGAQNICNYSHSIVANRSPLKLWAGLQNLKDCPSLDCKQFN